jgi:hypothetical protein
LLLRRRGAGRAGSGCAAVRGRRVCPAGPEQFAHVSERGRRVHVMRCGDTDDEVEARRLEREGEEVAEEVVDLCGAILLPGDVDAVLVDVDRRYEPHMAAQLAGEDALAAADVERAGAGNSDSAALGSRAADRRWFDR